jgi:hypothetical protein
MAVAARLFAISRVGAWRIVTRRLGLAGVRVETTDIARCFAPVDGDCAPPAVER